MLASSIVASLAFASLAVALPRPQVDERGLLDGLLNLDILGGSNGHALINLDVLAGILSSDTCGVDAVVGVQVSLLLPGLLDLCLCVNVLQLGGNNLNACPSCVAKAHPICGGPGTCACECDAGFYASSFGTCIPVTNCPPPNVLTQLNDGTSSCSCTAPQYTSDGAGGCVCKSPYVAGPNGGCVLGPSQLPRKSKKSQLSLGDVAVEEQDALSMYFSSSAYRCPNGERACPVGNAGNGWECLDTTSALDSCGGCLVAESLGSPIGQNCLAIPGALGVSCQSSQCEVSSCYPGWRFVHGRCSPM